MIVSIANEKGGVAKSTSTAAIGSILSSQGRKVVLIDLDPQGDLTVALNVAPEDRNIFDCIFTHRGLLATNVNPNLVLVGGDPRMTSLAFMDYIREEASLKKKNPQFFLKNLLKGVENQADFVLLDCPPNLEIITQNALAASDYLIIPTEPHTFSIAGVETMLEYARPTGISVLGFFLTRFRQTTSIHREVHNELRKAFPKRMFSTVIRENVTVQEATHLGTEFEKYGRRGEKENKRPFRGLGDYRKLTEEILTKIRNYEKTD